MSQHTPGPWTLKPNNGVRVPFRIEGDGWTVCEVYWNEHMEGEPEANARLMAAAPEMKDLLTTLVNDMLVNTPSLKTARLIAARARALLELLELVEGK